MDPTRALTFVSDDELLRRLAELLRQSRGTEADLVAHIGEVDARRLYAREASPSMFAYCTERLRLSEAEAYRRIAAARASREHPMLLTMLADGRLHLTAIAKLAPHLTPESRESLLARAAHKTKREVEELIAAVAPRPDAPALMRKLPQRATGLGMDGDVSSDGTRRPDRRAATGGELRLDAVAEAEGPSPSSVVVPATPATVLALAPGRYKVQFTASEGLREKLERLQTLMRSSVPDGDLAAVIEAAVTEKLEPLEARRFARTKAPRKGRAEAQVKPSSRYIPAAPCMSGTETVVDSWTSRAGAARPATRSSTTIATPSAWVATTPRTESPFSVGRTTSTWRRSISAGGPWPPIGGRSGRQPDRRGSSDRPEGRVARTVLANA